MKEALYYEKKDNKLQCHLCPRNCVIAIDKAGFCRVRKNIKNKLYSMVYAKPISAHIDPIEKKPLYHFLPGTKALSIGTVGCNLACKHCQNWEMSQAFPGDFPEYDLPPALIVEEAIKTGCKSISYTYNEPTIFYEYALDTAKIAKKKGIKNTIVSNGFINEEPLKQWCKYIDGANIDLKSIDDKFYRKITSAWVEPVLNTLKILKENNVWFEITNLIIPTLNDNLKDIEKLCNWVKNNLGVNNPIHFTAFYPCYKLTNLPRTSPDILKKAYNTAKKTGINYVYIGNVFADKEGNTYCPKCGELLIERSFFEVLQNNITHSKCSCGNKIPGVWE